MKCNIMPLEELDRRPWTILIEGEKIEEISRREMVGQCVCVCVCKHLHIFKNSKRKLLKNFRHWCEMITFTLFEEWIRRTWNRYEYTRKEVKAVDDHFLA